MSESNASRQRWRLWTAMVLVFVVFAGSVPTNGAYAAPKKKAADRRDERIEQLEKQVLEQSRLLKEMQQQIVELKRGQREASAPGAGQQSGAAPQTPATAPQATPAQESPVLDESVPPPPTGTSPATRSPTTIPPEGPVLDETVPPPPNIPTPQTPTANVPPPVRWGGTTTPPQAGNALNPAISAIGLFEARTSNDKSVRSDNQLSAREVEVALQAPIDPFARYDVFVTIPNANNASLEEGYATFLRMPFDFQGKMGQFKAAFGRNNELHTHAFPQIDRPQVIRQFFGEEGLNGPGASLSNILPLPWYSELLVQGIANDNDTLFSAGVSQKPIYVMSWRNLFDLREDLTAELGISGAYGKSDAASLRNTKVGGLALTVKYKPLNKLGLFGITWESEYLAETQHVPVFSQPEHDPVTGIAPPPVQIASGRRAANGLYSYVDVQANRNWFFDVRYDWTHLPIDPNKVLHGWTALAGYRFSEFDTVRLQYSDYKRNWTNDLRQLFLQWNIIIGPHGAHKY